MKLENGWKIPSLSQTKMSDSEDTHGLRAGSATSGAAYVNEEQSRSGLQVLPMNQGEPADNSRQ